LELSEGYEIIFQFLVLEFMNIAVQSLVFPIVTLKLCFIWGKSDFDTRVCEQNLQLREDSISLTALLFTFFERQMDRFAVPICGTNGVFC